MKRDIKMMLDLVHHFQERVHTQVWDTIDTAEYADLDLNAYARGVIWALAAEASTGALVLRLKEEAIQPGKRQAEGKET